MKVSVIIPTFNRFKHLLNAIDSVKRQTYSDIELIVVNDRSTQKEYYSYDFPGVTIVHLDKGAIERHGKPMPGCHPRNIGLKIASGEYVAFLDDDDMWLPKKIETQIKYMTNSGCQMCCSDGYIGTGKYEDSKDYLRYNAEHYWGTLKEIYRKKKKSHLFPISSEDGFPKIWDLDFLNVHNCCITSSVIVSKDIADKVGEFKILNFAEDYHYWKRALGYTKCCYISEPLFYYDMAHGGGKNY